MRITNDMLIGSFVAFVISLVIVAIGTAITPEKQQIQRTRPCDDIIRYEDGSLVCEINIRTEDSI